MTKSETQELLVQLYLRLNGYFTTGLIVHSPEFGNNLTEIDCLAIRNPYHEQPERGVEPPEFLQIEDGITDIIICEVKTSTATFNTSLRSNPESLENVLRWAGMFPIKEIPSVADELRPLLQDDTSIEDMRNGVVRNNVRFRALLSCPPQSEPEETKWLLTGGEIFRFANLCLSPEKRRETCSTRYPLRQWYPFSDIVEILKSNDIMHIDQLYTCLNIED